MEVFDSCDDDRGTYISTHINLKRLWLRLINEHRSLTELPYLKHVSKNMPDGHCEKRRFECLDMRPSQPLGSHLSLDGNNEWQTCTCSHQMFNGTRAPGRSHMSMLK